MLDRDVLEDLRELTPDGSLLVQIADTFVSTAPEHVAELRAAVATADADLVRQAAHRLRGAAGALGAVKVARLCTRLEEMSVQGRLDGAPAVASAIETALGRATADLPDTVGPRPVSR